MESRIARPPFIDPFKFKVGRVCMHGSPGSTSRYFSVLHIIKQEENRYGNPNIYYILRDMMLSLRYNVFKYLCTTEGRGRPSLKQLDDHVVQEAAVKWRDLGVQLLKNNSTLDIIEANHKVSNLVCSHDYESTGVIIGCHEMLSGNV